MSNEKKEIAVCLIATNKYKQFVQPLVDSINKNFLKNHNITVHLFTDELAEYYGSDRVMIQQHLIPAYKFPEATLFRYKIFSDHEEFIKKSDYAFYLDVDMRIDKEVGDEILEGNLTAVRHPGFFMNNGWGSPNVDKRSHAWLALELCKKYFAGGFQGGKTDVYLKVCHLLARNIEEDNKNGVMAQWHDESHWNKLINMHPAPDPTFTINELTPSYCMVEQLHLREKWGISNLEPKIIALEKNHAELRS